MPTARSGNRVLMRSASSSRSTCLRLDRTTCAPCSARAFAIALPMPRLAPVTSATRPSRLKRELFGTADTISRLNGDDLGEGGRGHPRADLSAHHETERHGPGRGNSTPPEAPRLRRDVEQGFLLARAHPEVRARLWDGASEPVRAVRLIPHAHSV